MQRLSRLRCYVTLRYTTLHSEVDQRLFSDMFTMPMGLPQFAIQQTPGCDIGG